MVAQDAYSLLFDHPVEFDRAEYRVFDLAVRHIAEREGRWEDIVPVDGRSQRVNPDDALQRQVAKVFAYLRKLRSFGLGHERIRDAPCASGGCRGDAKSEEF